MVNPFHAVPLRPRRSVSVERAVPFSPVIVWDALVDADLADGWLGHLIVEPVEGGRFALVWPTDEPHQADWFGTIEQMIPAERLAVAFAPHTLITFELRASLVSDRRGSQVAVLHESFLTSSEAEAVARFWSRRLDLLHSLLGGHPVVWRHGERPD
ncbi:SRPBCC domain-containing protein [Agreia sp. COWG]|uniref:SRPBCC family protein n=1 Tax=Agreia sp. COWG TaxID=2773266 RepID=UPI00192748D3|nr:SRPBCC domain-containing protein [Agreia sp. COWG]CAD6000018.1 conserved protein of unknown function [Agreia sp. COWG]